MIQPIQDTQLHFFPSIEKGKKGQSPLCGRIQLNWSTAILFCNTAMILAGAAFMFFIKLPLISLGLLGYGIGYLVADGFARKALLNGEEVQTLKTKIERQEKIIGDKEEQIKKVLESQDVRPELRQEIQELRETIQIERENLASQERRSAKTKARLSKEIQNLRIERNYLRDN